MDRIKSLKNRSLASVKNSKMIHVKNGMAVCRSVVTRNRILRLGKSFLVVQYEMCLPACVPHFPDVNLKHCFSVLQDRDFGVWTA